MAESPKLPSKEFIPAEIKEDAFAAAITELARRENLRNILEIGASSGEGSTEAWMRGMRESGFNVTLHCIEMSPARSEALRRRWVGETRLKCYTVSSVPRDRWTTPEEVGEFYRNVPTNLNQYSLDQVLEWLREGIEQFEAWKVPENGIELIRRENGIDIFDAVLIDGSAFTGQAELDEVYGARFILLDDISDIKNHANYKRLLADPQYVLIKQDWRVRNGFSIFARADEKAAQIPRPDPLPVHFFTIVLDGEPFIRYHMDVFKKLPFDWHWHIVEGVADLVHDTAWSVKTGGQVPARYPSGRSTDGTSEYLDELAAAYPDRVTVYRKPTGVRWEGKREMVSAPLKNIPGECLLWQIDADELWTQEQFITGRKLFLDDPRKTAAMFWCWFFVGPDLVTCTRFTYPNNPRIEWLRVWRFRPGMAWATHEPPALIERINPSTGRSVAAVNPIMHDATEAAGLVFQHFAYATMPQILFKEEYYGYSGALAGWLALQEAENFPAPLGRYFPWVKDATMVDQADYYIDPLFKVSPAGLWPVNAPAAQKPTVMVDSMFFQLDQTSGIARVWRSLLSQWVADGFAKNIVVVDRLGKAPKFPGIRYRTAAAYDASADEADRRMLQRICDQEGADVFISTYYTSPISTPSVFLVHDMIPEATKMDLNFWRWQLKHRGLRHASAFVCVSESTRRDLLRFVPEISGEKVSVIHNGIDPVFQPRSPEEIDAFRRKRDLTKPYFLLTNVTLIPYKNDRLSFRALSLLADGGKFDVFCTSRKPLPEEYTKLLPPGMNIHMAWLEDEEFSQAYSGAGALLYPSLYEGFGLPVLEAMACGCPVITTKTSAIPEVAGDAAIYVSPTDPAEMAAAMAEIQNDEIRNRLIEQGLKRAKTFSWSEAADKLRGVLLKVAQLKAK